MALHSAHGDASYLAPTSRRDYRRAATNEDQATEPRRAAIELMTQARAPKAKRGSASLIDRTSLLSWTETIFKDESWQLQRLQETSEELSRSVLEIQAVRAALHQEGRTLI